MFIGPVFERDTRADVTRALFCRVQTKRRLQIVGDAIPIQITTDVRVGFEKRIVTCVGPRSLLDQDIIVLVLGVGNLLFEQH
jgi:hypothetical protein